MASHIITAALASGELKAGQTVVDFSSGNTGIAVAMVCASLAIPCVLIMPQHPLLRERYLTIRALGGHVHLTAPAKGIKGMEEHFDWLLRQSPGEYFGLAQFTSPQNPLAYYSSMGPEIWEQTGGEVDYFVQGVGTGGCIAGTGAFLKEAAKKGGVVVVAVEPTEARVHIGEEPGAHTIVGIGSGTVANFFGLSGPLDGPQPIPGIIDEWASATSEEAATWCQKAARKEGLLVGPSAGAALKVAVDIASRSDAAGKTIVVVLPSHAIRYAGHGLWDGLREESDAALPVPANLDLDARTCLFKSSDYSQQQGAKERGGWD